MLAFADGAIERGDTCIITVAVTSTTVGAAVNTTGPVMYNGGTGGTATATLTVTPVADLAITKTDGLTAVAPGATIGYAIVVTNGGPTAVTGASVTDTFPGTFTNVTWFCTASGGASCNPAVGAGNINATVNLAVGEDVTFAVIGTVAPNATGLLVNTATVTAPAGVDPNPKNDSATDTDTVSTGGIPTTQADLAITKDDGVTEVTPGETITYTIVVTNGVVRWRPDGGHWRHGHRYTSGHPHGRDLDVRGLRTGLGVSRRGVGQH